MECSARGRRSCELREPLTPSPSPRGRGEMECSARGRRSCELREPLTPSPSPRGSGGMECSARRSRSCEPREPLTPSPSPRGRGEMECSARGRRSCELREPLTPFPSPRGRGEMESAALRAAQNRLKLQKNTSLALYSVLEFAGDATRHISAAEIAGKYGVSSHHLAKVLAELARVGILESVRGVGGGYRFAGNARRLTLMDVICTFE